MTKRIFFAALVLCLGAFTCVSCSDDDDKSVASSSDTSVSSSDLIGTWRDWDGTNSATITQDNLTVTQGGNPIYSGPWSLTGSTLVTGEKSQQVELLLGKKLFLGTDDYLLLLRTMFEARPNFLTSMARGIIISTRTRGRFVPQSRSTRTARLS